MGIITEESIEDFRRMMREEYRCDLDFDQAKVRYLQLLNLFWILAHRAPKPGEPPYEPPPPPWL